MTKQQLAYETETTWLREIMIGTGGFLFFPSELEQELRTTGRSRPEVVRVLQDGDVSYSEKADFGWQWWVDGTDCDDSPVRVVLVVDANTLYLEILQVLWG